MIKLLNIIWENNIYFFSNKCKDKYIKLSYFVFFHNSRLQKYKKEAVMLLLFVYYLRVLVFLFVYLQINQVREFHLRL